MKSIGLFFETSSSPSRKRATKLTLSVSCFVRLLASLFAGLVLFGTARAQGTFSPSNGSTTLAATTNRPITPVTFNVTGLTYTVRSWEILSGTNFPPGLTFGSPTDRKSGIGVVNTINPTLEGTPTTAGTYVIRLIAWELVDRGGLSSATFTYTVNVTSSTVTAPVIVTQPSSQTAVRGANVTFTVAATNAQEYQWRRNGVVIAGANGSSLILNNITTADAGAYDVEVRNTAGPTTSSSATLTIIDVLPAITAQPQGQTVAVGATLRLSVTATNAVSYQWRKDGANIPNAINSTLTITNVSTGDAGAYTVEVRNSLGPVVSSVAVVTVNGFATPAITTQPQGASVLADSTVALTVSATGVFSYQWRRGGINLPGATSSTLVLTKVSQADAGTYTVVLSNQLGTTVTSNPATVTIATGGTLESKISNLSVRTPLVTGQILQVGFVTDGPKSLLLRAVGPSLSATFGLPDYVRDPFLNVFNNSGTQIATNDTWDPGLNPTFSRLGAFPLTIPSLDAALLQTVTGRSTAMVSSTGPGVVLVEVYDADLDSSSTRLTNVSARNQVGTGDYVLISGFVIRGSVAKTVMIRGVGPALKDVFGVSGNLTDPKLELYSGSTKIAENDNWDSSLTRFFAPLGAYAFQNGSRDSVIMITLPPGEYTAQVSGVDNAIGDGVVEVFVVP